MFKLDQFSCQKLYIQCPCFSRTQLLRSQRTHRPETISRIISKSFHVLQLAPLSKSPKLIQKRPSIPRLPFYIYKRKSVPPTKGSTQIKNTHSNLRRIPQNLLNPLQNLRRQFRDHLKRLEVLRDLLRTRRAENDGGRVGVLRDPCEGEGAHGRVEFYRAPGGGFNLMWKRMRWGETDLPLPTWSIPLLYAASLGLQALAVSLLCL